MVFKEMGMNGEERTIVAGTPGDAEGGRRPTGASPGEAPRKRWTAARKQEVVLRRIRGETLEAVSRDVGVPPIPADGRADRARMGIP